MPNPLNPPPPTGIGILDRWLALLWRKLTAAGEILWAQVSKAGSNLTDIETRNHADLQNLNTASYTHLTATNHADLTDGGDTLLHYHLRHDVTGVLTGGILSVSVGGTTFSITDGTGQVVNNYTTPLTPTITPVSWSGKTNVTDTLLGDPANYILINSAGAVVQQNTAPTDDELRDKILVGVIAHANNLIIAFAPLVVTAYNNGNLAQDMLSILGTITTGCTYAGNSALTLRRAAGTVFRRGAHYLTDTKTPNHSDLTAQDPVQFSSYCRNGSNTVFSNSAIGSTLTVNRYDDGTAAAAGIPNGVVNNNQWQALRIFLSTNGNSLIQYGQTIYNSLNSAVESVGGESWFQAPITRLTAFRGYLFVRGGASNLSSSGDAFFLGAGKLGDIGSVGSSPVFVHNDLSGLQGGTTGEYYHLTSAEYTGSGTGVFLRTTSPTMVTPVLGVPASGTLTNCIGLPISTGISGLGAGVATFLGTPSSANLASAVTDETGSGALVFGSSPTISGPVISSGNLTFSGTAQKISGDFSTSVISNRPIIQSSVINGNTNYRSIPNGTGNNAGLQAGNSNDPDNQSVISVNASTVDCSINSTRNGTGAFLPLGFYTNSVQRVSIDAPNGHVTPGADNTQNFGSGSLRWKEFFAGNAVINTSDAREKTSVRALTVSEMAAAKQLSAEIGVYQWLAAIAEKGENGARLHIGMTVQRAMEIFAANGLDPYRYGLVCYDSWDELNISEEVDADDPAGVIEGTKSVQKTERQAREWQAVEVIDGVATLVTKREEFDAPVFKMLPVFDEAGNPLMKNGEQLTHQEPVMIDVPRYVKRTNRSAGNRYGFRGNELLILIAAGFHARIEVLENTH